MPQRRSGGSREKRARDYSGNDKPPNATSNYQDKDEVYTPLDSEIDPSENAGNEKPADLLKRLEVELQDNQSEIEDLNKENIKRTALLEEMKASHEEANTCIEGYGDAYDALGARRADLHSYLGTKGEMLSTVAKPIVPLYDEAVEKHGKQLEELEHKMELASRDLEQAQSKSEQAREELARVVQEFNNFIEFKLDVRLDIESMEDCRKRIQDAENESEPDIAAMYVDLKKLEWIHDSTKLLAPDEYAANLNDAWKVLLYARKEALEAQEKRTAAQAKLDQARVERDALANSKRGYILERIREKLLQQPISSAEYSQLPQDHSH